jgi:pimeloyl-ACP methyl ester carboxylesterase
MTNTEAGFAEVNGTRLYFELAGQGAPLVLIHGFGLDHRVWDEQFRDYSRRFRVLRYDLRGFGRSAPPASQPYRHLDDLRALLDHVDLPRAGLIGLSMGGWVAINFALEFPHRVDTLVLVDAILDHQPMSREWDDEVGPIWREARAKGVEATKLRWLNISLFASARAHPQAGPRLAQILADWSGWQFANRDPEHTGAGAVERLGDIQAPTLVVIGEHDLPDFQAMSERLLAIPLARKVTIPGAGHLPPLEASGLLDAVVLGFLDHV